MTASESSSNTREEGGLSQWQLIGLRFHRHRMAVWFLYILLFLYGLVSVAEFVSPYSKSRRNVQYSYAPPQIPRFSFVHGFYVYEQVQRTDKVTLARYYEINREVRIPLGFFVRGEPYRLFGLIPSESHFFGIQEEVFKRRYIRGGI